MIGGGCYLSRVRVLRGWTVRVWIRAVEWNRTAGAVVIERIGQYTGLKKLCLDLH
jgi:hypothetical protein